MSIEFSGAKSGFNTFELRPDGSFDSNTDFSIGTMSFKSHLIGKMVDGRITAYKVVQVQGGVSSSFEWDGKTLKYDQAGKLQEFDLVYTGTSYFGNVHPQINAGMFKPLDFAKKEPQKVRTFLLDAGAVLEPSITPGAEKTIRAGTARFYEALLGTVKAQYAVSDKGNVVGLDVPSQKLRFVTEGWEALYSDPLAAYPELSPATFATRADVGVKMKTRDGATLVMDIIRPDAPGRYPVILTRTPYGRAGAAVDGRFYASRGYVLVSQDCRGRGDSTGQWDPFVNESRDGYDTIDWASKQPWSNGKVGMIGASYGGLVQWAAAVENHPALKCLVPQVSPPDAMRNIPYDMGTFFLYGNLWWGKIVRGKDADMSGLMSALPHPDKFDTLPLSKVDDAVLGYNVPFFDKWLEREGSVFWSGFRWSDQVGKTKVPALHISGWWDGDLIGTQTNWASIRAAGRKDQWLVYGPWTHAFNTTSSLGDVDYGPSAILELDSLYLRWFDTWLKGKDVGMAKVPKVRAFVTGANRWVNLDDWPSSTSKAKTLYLFADAPANGKSSRGQLRDAPAPAQEPSRYIYNPANAEVPKELIEVDPTKASTIINLEDNDNQTLVFKTAKLAKNTAISGPIDLTIRFQSSAKDTVFFALVVDIDEKGVMRQIGRMGKVRAAFVSGFDKPRPLVPGKTVTATIALWDTAHEFKAGHQMGLLITSGMFPIYARNLGTAEPIKNATRMVVQANTIFHDKKNPSYLKFRVLW
jgi:putative CocE/NonD family hydrolase